MPEIAITREDRTAHYASLSEISAGDLSEMQNGFPDLLKSFVGVFSGLSRRDFLKAAGVLFLALVAACSPASATVESKVSSVDATAEGEVELTPIASSTVTILETPTSEPIILPERSGTLHQGGDGTWIFNSPLEAEIGKNVTVEIVQHETDEGDVQEWIVPTEHADWPLFIRNGDSEWRTAREYFEVKGRFVDTDGTDASFTKIKEEPSVWFDFAIIYPLIVGEVFVGSDGYSRIPVALSTDGDEDSPMCEYNAVIGPEGFSLLVREQEGKSSFVLVEDFAGALPVGYQVEMGFPQSINDGAGWLEEYNNEVKDGFNEIQQKYYSDWFEKLPDNNELIASSFSAGECIYPSQEGVSPEIWNVPIFGR